VLRYLGCVGSPLGISAPIDRTARLANASRQRLGELIAGNIASLATVLRYAVSHEIFLQRLSSGLIPFASHPNVDLPDWRRDFGLALREIGDFVRANGMRISVHPGQFTVLNSPNHAVVESATRELAYHAALFDTFGLGVEHKIVFHIGGVYEDKVQSLDRFVETVLALPDRWRERFVVENDERLYTVEDALLISRRTGLPVVFDWLHHQLNPGSGARPTSDLIASAFATWGPADGPPKCHYSTQSADGQRGAHADWVDVADFLKFLRVCPAWATFDCMLEVKKKDLALLRLRNELRRRGVTLAEAQITPPSTEVGRASAERSGSRPPRG
jgi:UV DNA damage endonuclease